ncbi:MAG: PEP-CTERM sorting domain-containing protein [Rubrivivax sp.]|nr:MAG: PEP-CTERM sorting domain-containing protein [Rubrivivax sp.]
MFFKHVTAAALALCAATGVQAKIRGYEILASEFIPQDSVTSPSSPFKEITVVSLFNVDASGNLEFNSKYLKLDGFPSFFPGDAQESVSGSITSWSYYASLNGPNVDVGTDDFLATFDGSQATFVYSLDGASTRWVATSFKITPVPEPSVYLSTAAGLLVVGSVFRRVRKI